MIALRVRWGTIGKINMNCFFKEIKKSKGIACTIDCVNIDNPIKTTHQIECDVRRIGISHNLIRRSSINGMAVIWSAIVRQFYARYIEKRELLRVHQVNVIDKILPIIQVFWSKLLCNGTR